MLNINSILLVGITTTFIAGTYSLDNYNLQNQRYDYIDVAKATAGSRNKGQTTRIFTADDDLDEKFWLKYLGEDFRHAVHLQVDAQNNVVPLVDQLEKSLNLPTVKYNPKADKGRTRFVRQPTQQKNYKQLPVEILDENNFNENQYPTETPETFNVYLSTSTTATTTTTTALPPANTKQYSHNTQQRVNNRKPSKQQKDRNLLSQKAIKVKRCRLQKATNEPIVVHLPETDDSIHHINQDYVPVSPLIYHQKAKLYPEMETNRQFIMHKNQLFAEQAAPNLNLNNENIEFYSQPLQLNTQHLYPQHRTGYTTHSHQPHFTTVHNTRPQHKIQQHEKHHHHLLTPTQYTTHKRFKQIYP